MNFWWRLFAHLAPTIPGSRLLANVESRARADVPETLFPHWAAVESKECDTVFRAMVLAVEDEVELARVTRRFEHLVALYSRDKGVLKTEAFKKVYRMAYKHRVERALTVYEFNHLFRLYLGPKWEKRKEHWRVRNYPKRDGHCDLGKWDVRLAPKSDDSRP